MQMVPTRCLLPLLVASVGHQALTVPIAESGANPRDTAPTHSERAELRGLSLLQARAQRFTALSRSSPARAATTTTKTVYLFRHCICSETSSSLAPYTATAFPSFGVESEHCLPKGLELFKGIGAQLKSSVGTTPTIIVDDKQRNVDSSHALATGLGIDPSSAQIDYTHTNPINPWRPCKEPSQSDKTKMLSKRIQSVPRPPNASAMVAAIDAVLGGKSHISSEPDRIELDEFKGESALAAKAAEMLIMQLGGGMELGWGKVTSDEAYQLLAMQVYVRSVTRRIPKIAQAKSSRMLASILAALGPSGGHGASDSTIILGHDTDIDGVGTLLDIGWKAPPFPDNTTAPSVALRFQSVGDNILIDFVYPQFDVPDSALQFSRIANVSVASFCNTATDAIDWSCASPHPVGSVCSGQ